MSGTAVLGESVRAGELRPARPVLQGRRGQQATSEELLLERSWPPAPRKHGVGGHVCAGGPLLSCHLLRPSTCLPPGRLQLCVFTFPPGLF